jgi:two-component system NtrC family sensor kinase
MAGLLRFFYRWTFYPVRDLQAGVGRVALGDFEHRIDVHSGDEMEELAAAFNDMTRRLRDIYADLARQVNERSRQLVRSERLAGVGFLAAGVAHEINNPLASIAFCSEALEARLAEVFASGPRPRSNEVDRRHPAAPRLALLSGQDAGQIEQQEVITKYLKMIQEEAFRCKAITQKLLEFSRGGERRREPADLAELIQSVLDIVQHLPTCKAKNINFTGVQGPQGVGATTDVGLQPGGRLIAWVNPQEVRSVVLNLVVNALESMDEGGTLTISLRLCDGQAELVFADSGCGMTADVLENIFEPFFTRSRTGKGTGLGLSISHRIITQHGGDIEATSAGPNQGSTFTVRLPLQPPESALEETPPPAHRPAA